MDKFILSHILPLIHVPVLIYDDEGKFEEALEDIKEGSIIDSDKFIGKATDDLPYLDVDKDGVAFCVMWDAKDRKYVVFGEVCIYGEFERDNTHIPFCGKEEYVSAACIAWKVISGKDASKTDILFRNIVFDVPI